MYYFNCMELVYLYSSEGAQQAIPAAQEPLAGPVPQFMNGSVLAVDCTCNNGIVHFWFFQQMGRKGLFFFFFFFIVPLLKFLGRLLTVSSYCICSLRMVTWESVQLGGHKYT